MPNDAHPFGQRMAVLRQELGLSQAELGRRLEISRGMVAYYETSAKNPSLDFIEKVANTFKVPVGTLIDSEQKARPGRPSRLEQLLDEVSHLPKSKQKFVVQMIEGFLRQEREASDSAA